MIEVVVCDTRKKVGETLKTRKDALIVVAPSEEFRIPNITLFAPPWQ